MASWLFPNPEESRFTLDIPRPREHCGGRNTSAVKTLTPLLFQRLFPGPRACHRNLSVRAGHRSAGRGLSKVARRRWVRIGLQHNGRALCRIDNAPRATRSMAR